MIISTLFKIYKLVPIILVVLALITIIISKRNKYTKGIVLSLVACYFSCTMCSAGYLIANSADALYGMSKEAEQAARMYDLKVWTILIIISIIIQLIPFIICLKNNKKIKKDEVKQ